jgi:DNA excision repair protein ERCC-2
MDILFPHETVRNIQQAMMTVVSSAVTQGKDAIIHAPTGLGKTAAALAPALTSALQKSLTIFFLTSRQTQHQIVLDTIKKIKEKHNVTFTTVSFVGKKWMCGQAGATALHAGEFIEYCKKLREEDKCSYYINARKKTGLPTVEALHQIQTLQETGPHTTEEVVNRCVNLCPYEISIELAKKAKIIILDYNHLFNPRIREIFLKKVDKDLNKSIVIIDEGHNLPERIRETNTMKLNSFVLRRAKNEAKNYDLEEVYDLVDALEENITALDVGEERLISREEIMNLVDSILPYASFVDELETAAKIVKEEQKQSSLGSIAQFLTSWLLDEKGYCRIVTRYKDNTEIVHRCLDPSVIAKEVIGEAYSTIIMSGTLTPTAMFHDILGFTNDSSQNEFPSPFPEKNKLALIIPRTTTKYSSRSETQYKEIARICAEITNTIDGCSAIFFPSYALRNNIENYFHELSVKTVFREEQGMSKQDKTEVLGKLTSYQNKGAILLGIAAGSFGEGVDLPGILKCVIVVGLPLSKPTLEIKELIKYYDVKFAKGWEYGYVLPAITKTLQNAGRCIRSEKDKGVLIFLDERYMNYQYKKCFPTDWNLKISLKYTEKIKEFFH